MQQKFEVQVSERSMRRVQIIMAAVQTAEQTSKAVSQTAEGIVQQARQQLTDALGTICEAHDETMPDQYTIGVDIKTNTITITDNTPPTLMSPLPFVDPDAKANGQDHASVPVEASEGTGA